MKLFHEINLKAQLKVIDEIIVKHYCYFENNRERGIHRKW